MCFNFTLHHNNNSDIPINFLCIELRYLQYISFRFITPFKVLTFAVSKNCPCTQNS